MEDDDPPKPKKASALTVKAPKEEEADENKRDLSPKVGSKRSLA